MQHAWQQGMCDTAISLPGCTPLRVRALRKAQLMPCAQAKAKGRHTLQLRCSRWLQSGLRMLQADALCLQELRALAKGSHVSVTALVTDFKRTISATGVPGMKATLILQMQDVEETATLLWPDQNISG